MTTWEEKVRKVRSWKVQLGNMQFLFHRITLLLGATQGSEDALGSAYYEDTLRRLWTVWVGFKCWVMSCLCRSSHGWRVTLGNDRLMRRCVKRNRVISVKKRRETNNASQMTYEVWGGKHRRSGRGGKHVNDSSTWSTTFGKVICDSDYSRRCLLPQRVSKYVAKPSFRNESKSAAIRASSWNDRCMNLRNIWYLDC